MVKYSAKKRTGSKKQSFKKRKYNKKKGGDGDNDKTPETPATETPATETTATETTVTKPDGMKVTKVEDDKTRVTKMKVDSNTTDLNMGPFCVDDDNYIIQHFINNQKYDNPTITIPQLAKQMDRPAITVRARIQELWKHTDKGTKPEYDEDCNKTVKENNLSEEKPTEEKPEEKPEEKKPASEEKNEKQLEKVFDDLINRILDQIDNICKKGTRDERKEILEDLILGKTE